jgi:hypothetical protein
LTSPFAGTVDPTWCGLPKAVKKAVGFGAMEPSAMPSSPIDATGTNKTMSNILVALKFDLTDHNPFFNVGRVGMAIAARPAITT